MATKQPDSITVTAAALVIGGRSLTIGDFITKKKDGSESKSPTLFIGKTAANGSTEVLESMTLTSKNIEAVKILAEAISKAKVTEDSDEVQDLVAPSPVSSFFTRFKAEKGKNLAASWQVQASQLAAYLAANHQTKGRDNGAMAAKALDKAVTYLLGANKSATREQVMDAISAMVTQENINKIAAQPRDEKTGFIKTKVERLKADPTAPKKFISLSYKMGLKPASK